MFQNYRAHKSPARVTGKIVAHSAASKSLNVQSRLVKSSMTNRSKPWRFSSEWRKAPSNWRGFFVRGRVEGMKRWRLTIGLALVATMPLLYPLSIGPAFWLTQHRYLHRDTYDRMYGPMEDFADNSGPPLFWIKNCYLNLCNLIPGPSAD